MGIFNTNSYASQVSYDTIEMRGTDAEFDNILVESFKDTYQLEAGLYIADILMEQKVVMESANAEVLMEAVAGNLFERIKKLFKNIWEKIKSWFEAFVKNIKMMMVSGKKFIKEFGSELRKKNSTGFKYMGYEYSSDFKKIETIHSKCISVVESNVKDLNYTKAVGKLSGEEAGVLLVSSAAMSKEGFAHDTSDKVSEWKEVICKSVQSNCTSPEEITSEMTHLLGNKIECADFDNMDKSAMITKVDTAEKIIEEIKKACTNHEKSINSIISDVNKLEKEFKDVDEAKKGKVTTVITAVTTRLSFLVTLRGTVTKTYADILKAQAKDCENTLKAYIRFKPAKDKTKNNIVAESNFENILESALNFI